MSIMGISTKETRYDKIGKGISDRIRELRRKDNMTQEQFAEKIGVTANAISKLECGESKLSIETALSISDVCNVSLDWLFCKRNTMENVSKNILINLRELLKITFIYGEPNSYYIEGQEFILLTIDDCLRDFLMNYEAAENAKTKMGISDKLYESMLCEIEENYNKMLRSGKRGNPIKYQLVNPEDPSYIPIAED